MGSVTLTTVYDLALGSEVLLRGQTSLFPWSCRSSQATGHVTLHVDDAVLSRLFEKLQTGQIPAGPLGQSSGPPPVAELSVPVTSLHGGSEGMDRDMNQALKDNQFPLITYRLETIQDAKPTSDQRTGKPAFELGVTGSLIVAGVQRAVATRVTIQQNADHHYLAYAKVPIRMTDFGVKPPVAFFGLVRALDSLAVIFQLKFVPRQSSLLGPDLQNVK